MNSRIKVLESIRKASAFFLTGSLGIIAFFNTALIEQAILLKVEEAEYQSLLDGINHLSFNLLISCIFFLLSIMPFEEIYEMFKSIFRNSEPSIEKKGFIFASTVSLCAGFVWFTYVFISYISQFIKIL